MIKTPPIDHAFLNEEWFVKLSPPAKQAYVYVMGKITATGRWKKDNMALRKFKFPDGPNSFLRLINADQPRIVEEGLYWYQAATGNSNSLS